MLCLTGFKLSYSLMLFALSLSRTQGLKVMQIVIEILKTWLCNPTFHNSRVENDSIILSNTNDNTVIDKYYSLLSKRLGSWFIGDIYCPYKVFLGARGDLVAEHQDSPFITMGWPEYLSIRIKAFFIQHTFTNQMLTSS